MTNIDVIEMARKAGFVENRGNVYGSHQELEWLATLVAAAAKAEEREACAKVCDEAVAELIASECNKDLFEVAVGLRDAIRARGEASIRSNT